jgi:hypothetical protein
MNNDVTTAELYRLARVPQAFSGCPSPSPCDAFSKALSRFGQLQVVPRSLLRRVTGFLVGKHQSAGRGVGDVVVDATRVRIL